MKKNGTKVLTVEEVNSKIAAGDYSVETTGYSPESLNEIAAKKETLLRYFKRDALAATGLSKHPKARKALSLALDMAKLNGSLVLPEALRILSKLSELVK